MQFASESGLLYAGLCVMAASLVVSSRYRLRWTGNFLGLLGLLSVAAFLWARRDAVGLAGLGMALIAVRLGRRRRPSPQPAPDPRRRLKDLIP